MRTKALTLALLMIVSALAGCIEGSDEKSDSTDDVIVDDRSGNNSIDFILDGSSDDLDSLVEIIPANSDDCNSGGGTWIEASERGGESYCDIDTLDIQRVVCESGNGTWIWVEIVFERSGGPVSHINSVDIDNDHELAGGHSHSHSHGDTTHTHWHEHGGICDPPSPNSEVLEELKIHCEIMGGNWTAPNATAEQNRGNDTRDQFSLSAFYRCVAGEPEISADDCERRGGTWFEERSLCYFEEEHEDDREERLIHQMFIVYPDNSSELMLCRGCIGIENLTVWNLTTTALTERNISMNYSTHEVGHNVSGINGSDSPSDGSWHWTLYVWNETDAANASWEESRDGGNGSWASSGGHYVYLFRGIAWAPNTTNISDIPVPRIFVENTDGDSEMTQEDCERRGGTWTEATDRDGVHYCDFEEDEREDDREESNDDSDSQADCEERGGTWTEETRECSQES